VTSRHLSVSKRGEATESEDAAAVRPDAWPVRAAVADGATESVFAGRWAERLVEGMVEREATPEALADALPDWQARWRAEVGAQTPTAPWYVQAKVTEGAFATLLALELQRDGRWRALTVGDGGLFQLRDGTVQRAWPTAAPDAFTNRPALVPSRSDRSVPTPKTTHSDWRPGDTFLLATDAVAAWLLRIGPAQARHWTADTFRAAVHAARAEDTLRTDDATLLVLEIGGTDASETT
jgi:hypothetical protein